MNRHLLILAAALLLPVCAIAKLKPNNPFSDGMVLQQQTEAPIWGTADAGAAIKVKTSWDNRTYKCTAGKDGKWKVSVNTPAASYTNYSITISSGKEKVTINDVLIGEVWLASGQSNMEMPMRGYYNNPIKGFMDVITAPSEADKVRMFTAAITGNPKPQDDAEGHWAKSTCETRADMSATAYYFAHRLNRLIDVPVGIITAAMGGTRLEAWMPKEIVESFGTEPTEEDTVAAEEQWYRPYFCYNAMQHPFQGYALKGFIWYQGCSNVGNHHQLVERMNLLITRWRNDWGDYDNALPFYMVEIAPYERGFDDSFQGSAYFREAQNKCSKEIPNCAVAHTNDLVEPWERNIIHPSDKKNVGDRLAFLAANRDYGMWAVECYSPEVEDCWKDGSLVHVKLSHTDQGINRTEGIEGLEVAGEDGVFHPVTKAWCNWDNGCMEVECGEVVENPRRLRYCWGDFKPGNLKNSYGLPVVPFEIWL